MDQKSVRVCDGDTIIDLETSINRNLSLAIGKRRNKGYFTIFRVPPSIRVHGDMKDYEPKIVSIGPYHQGKKHLKVTEEHKYECLDNILKRNQGRTSKDYIEKMEELEVRARNCYSEAISMESSEFVKMLLLDGCFIVEFLLLGASETKEFPMFETTLTELSVAIDLLLLENQVPFFILQSIYDLVVPPSQGRTNLTKLALKSIVFLSPNKALVCPTDPQNFVLDHLLHLFAWSSIHQNPLNTEGHHWRRRYLNFNAIETFCCLLLCCLILLFRNSKDKKARTARELHEAGVKFKIKEKQQQQGESMSNNIIFTDGVLEMSPLYCDDNSVIAFKNVIALEQCNCKKYQAYFTYYFRFLDELMDTSLDAELLEQKGILINDLGSNEEVAQVFNQLCMGIYIEDKENPYMKIGADLHNFCNSRWPRWRAKLYGDYLTNPWAIISLLAAAVLLLLTITQTVFTILQYVHPKPN